MKPAMLLRLTGLAVMVAGVLFAVTEGIESLLFPLDQALSERFVHPGLLVIEAVSWLYSALLLIGLIGLYIRQAERAGVFGFITFLLTFLGVALNVGSLWSAVMIFPQLAMVAPEFLDQLQTNPPRIAGIVIMLSLFLSGAGWVLFGLASVRANVLPRTAAALVTIGYVAILFVPVIPANLVGVGLVWMGHSLWTSAIAGENKVDAGASLLKSQL